MPTERWFCKIEFTFDVETNPSEKRNEGDEQVDFAQRAFYGGLRMRLEEHFPGDDGISWYLSTYPEGVVARRQS